MEMLENLHDVNLLSEIVDDKEKETFYQPAIDINKITAASFRDNASRNALRVQHSIPSSKHITKHNAIGNIKAKKITRLKPRKRRCTMAN